ncbi:MAG: hypothetical protein OZSIB_2963 [Candidatus Ozemobacter sibiricus]|jgi:hypothetical protein|uniref:TolB protein n=1 Tax=Candidatus Ozemobacter sibiricus TaxID=2268124 RepID=A0A367ZRI5_9BACT|nr:MAG: hypothetical protein OZSIB_2963 [Candidatus Ozemobacter sibiricus]
MLAAGLLMGGLADLRAAPPEAEPAPGPRSPFSYPAGRLLFSGERNGQWDLYQWVPEPGPHGTIVPLTRTPEPEGNPVWWPRHRLILCSRRQPDGRWGLVALRLDGTTAWTLTDPLGNLGWPQPSPWDDRILAVREDPVTGFTQPGWCVFPDGGFQPIGGTEDPAGGQMAWIAPDEILVTRVSPQGSDLCHRLLSTGEERPLVQGGRNWLPAAAPSGGPPFFFTRRVGQTGSIFSLRPRPDAPWDYDPCTLGRPYDWQPAVTPDREGLLFLSLRDGRFRVVWRRLDDGHEQEIPLTGFTGIYHPTWFVP